MMTVVVSCAPTTMVIPYEDSACYEDESSACCEAEQECQPIDYSSYTVDELEQQICALQAQRQRAYISWRRHEREADRRMAFDKLSYRRVKLEAVYCCRAVNEADAAIDTLSRIVLERKSIQTEPTPPTPTE